MGLILKNSRKKRVRSRKLFHPRDESDKIDCVFWDLFGATKMYLDPERYVSCGSYELLVSNVAHEMNVKLMIKKILFSLKFEIGSFSRATKQHKNTFENYFFVFDYTFIELFQMMFYQKLTI